MIIQNVCLSINKLCVMIHYILYSYFVYIIFKLCSMKYNLDILLNLTMDTLTSIEIRQLNINIKQDVF